MDVMAKVVFRKLAYVISVLLSHSLMNTHLRIAGTLPSNYLL